MTDDDDLRLLLRSPQLALDPSPALPDRVRRRARVVRRRRRVAGSGLVAAALLTGTLVGPGLLARARQGGPATVATGPTADPNFPGATSEVVTLAPAGISTYFKGPDWCTVARRQSEASICRTAEASGRPPLTTVLGAGTSSLSIDRITLAAGLAGQGVARVALRLSDGSTVEAAVTDGHGTFPRPVWWVEVPPHRTVERYTAYDDAGRVLAGRPG